MTMLMLATAARAAEESGGKEAWTIVVWVFAALSFVATGIGMKIWR